MKKHYILILAALLCLSASCRKDPIPVCNYKIVNINVPAASWKYSEQNNNNYFTAEIDVPEITEEAFDGGILNVYRTFNFDKSNASQQLLPSVRLVEEPAQDGMYRYTESIDYEYGIGWLNIYYTLSDFAYDDSTIYDPKDMTFRLVLVY